jgi:uroporphyrinogen-III synthase
MANARWRVAVTRDDKADGDVAAALAGAGFTAISVPVLVEGPAPDSRKLTSVARDLQSFDWIICASVRAVRAITSARGSRWPPEARTAAVGSVTAAAMRDAGARDPIVADTFTAAALWEKLQSLETWSGKRVLVTTVAGGRRDLIDGLHAHDAEVIEIEAYAMQPRTRDEIRHDWASAAPDAVIVGSAETARRLVDAVGVAALRGLKAIVPIGPTTAEVLAVMGINAEPPAKATFAAAVEKLKSLLPN